MIRRACTVLTHHPPAFHTARQLIAANPGGRYWNLTTGFPGSAADTSPAAVQEFRTAVARLYRTEQGRGHYCTVED